MAQSLPPGVASHLRTSRYVQRERPAASIPSRIRTLRPACEPVSRPMSVSPTIGLILALRGPSV